MRPDFISRDDFRSWLSTTSLKKLFRVGPWHVMTYINKCEQSGRPLPVRLVDGVKRWRPIDIYVRAKADCLELRLPEAKQVEQDIATLRAELASLRAAVEIEKHTFEQRDLMAALTGKAPASEREIVEKCQPYSRISGVYFRLFGTWCVSPCFTPPVTILTT